MKKLVFLSAFLATLQGSAQSKAPKSTWEFEVDPIAYALKGYSAHIIYNPGKIAIDGGVYGIDVPEALHGNKGFTQKTTGFGVKTSYLWGDVKGFYSGLGIGYAKAVAGHRDSHQKEEGRSIGVGAHAGYRLFIQKPKTGGHRGFYLAPWVSIDRNFSLEKIRFSTHEYKQSNWSFFPTVHLGYRF